MKNLSEYIIESVKKGVVYDIDALNNTDWKTFAKLISKECGEEYEDEDILMALKGLAGEGLKLKVEDFGLETPSFDDDLYLCCYPTNKYYSFSDREWCDENGK